MLPLFVKRFSLEVVLVLLFHIWLVDFRLILTLIFLVVSFSLSFIGALLIFLFFFDFFTSYYACSLNFQIVRFLLSRTLVTNDFLILLSHSEAKWILLDSLIEEKVGGSARSVNLTRLGSLRSIAPLDTVLKVPVLHLLVIELHPLLLFSVILCLRLWATLSIDVRPVVTWVKSAALHSDSN